MVVRGLWFALVPVFAVVQPAGAEPSARSGPSWTARRGPGSGLVPITVPCKATVFDGPTVQAIRSSGRLRKLSLKQVPANAVK
jgi:hypothetical protein